MDVGRYHWLHCRFHHLHWQIYTGKDEMTEQGLTFTVVTDLLEPFYFQGYEVYTDNFYSSPGLFQSLLDVEIRAMGTLRTNRVGVPSSVVDVKAYHRSPLH